MGKMDRFNKSDADFQSPPTKEFSETKRLCDETDYKMAKRNLGCFFVGSDGPRHRGNRLLSNSEQLPDTELPPEVEEGNIEYKLKLVNPNPSRLEHLVTQMKWRLREGQGEAVYEIGVCDNGKLAGLCRDEMDASIETLRTMSKLADAECIVLKEFNVADNKTSSNLATPALPKLPAPKVAWGETEDESEKTPPGSVSCSTPDKFVCEVLIRRSQDEDFMWTDLRVAMLGNVDAGKSTLCGVLTHGELDNGAGKARLNLFRHLHEIQSGHTSSISREILGFDKQGRMFNYENHSIESILDCSSKIITFIDLAGSQKYLKTTVFGLTGHCPDYAALVVNSKQGLVGTFREHLGLTVALRVLSFVCITKIDGTAPATVRRCRLQIENILKGPAVRRPAYVVSSLSDAEDAALQIKERTPVFMVSAVTGDNLSLLHHFLSRLRPALSPEARTQALQAAPRFSVDGVLTVTGQGTIITGLTTKGTIREEDTMLLGPFGDKSYQEVKVASIQCNRLPRRLAKCGQSVSLGFHNLERTPRKGMILQSSSYESYCVEEFTAEIYILQHTSSSKLKKGFEATVFIDSIRQTVEIIDMDREITTGQKTKVKLKFVQFPDVISIGSRLFFRNGRTKGMGTVVGIVKIPSKIRTSGSGGTPAKSDLVLDELN
ncbi:hypothetical protein ACHWQZ_G013977 [Mnemiopsis leidyi]